MTTALPICDYNNKDLTPLNPKFNTISTTLSIITTKDPVSKGPLLNRFESNDSKIESLEFKSIDFYDNETSEFNKLTEENLADVAFADKKITLESKRYISDFTNTAIWQGDFSNVEMAESTTMEFTAKNGDYFTFQELLDNILTFEKEDRPKTQWFGGIDCHHVYFEGLHLQKNGSYYLSWGS